ncbi:hypothetical protein ACFFQF_00950 [Haladaptatus pallidirubidus]|uniref:hypothetical protein n=1 Tax=Haladaptatus pallidirubidus TaxID=1008152 RepID=UPI0035E655CF
MQTKDGRITADGWHIEVDTPNGHTHTISPQKDVQYQPQEGGIPSITVPVEKNDKWSDERFEDAPMRVWKNGDRKPISTLDLIRQTESETELRGRGAVELENPAEREYDVIAMHDAVKELIETETDLVPNVDRPPTERDEDVLVQSATRQEEMENLTSFADTDPVQARFGGYISCSETCKPKSVPGDANIAPGPEVVSGPEYNGGQAYHFTEEGDRVVIEVRFDYDVPVGRVGMKIRDLVLGASNIEFRWTGAGASKAVFQEFSDSSESLSWKEIGTEGYWQPDRDYRSVIGRKQRQANPISWAWSQPGRAIMSWIRQPFTILDMSTPGRIPAMKTPAITSLAPRFTRIMSGFGRITSRKRWQSLGHQSRPN